MEVFFCWCLVPFVCWLLYKLVVNYYHGPHLWSSPSLALADWLLDVLFLVKSSSSNTIRSYLDAWWQAEPPWQCLLLNLLAVLLTMLSCILSLFIIKLCAVTLACNRLWNCCPSFYRPWQQVWFLVYLSPRRVTIEFISGRAAALPWLVLLCYKCPPSILMSFINMSIWLSWALVLVYANSPSLSLVKLPYLKKSKLYCLLLLLLLLSSCRLTYPLYMFI